MPTYVPVICSEGHVYGSVWVPLASLKAIRLGNRRLQRCPICGRFRMTRRVPPEEQTPEVLAAAEQRHDTRLF